MLLNIILSIIIHEPRVIASKDYSNFEIHCQPHTTCAIIFKSYQESEDSKLLCNGKIKENTSLKTSTLSDGRGVGFVNNTSLVKILILKVENLGNINVSGEFWSKY